MSTEADLGLTKCIFKSVRPMSDLRTPISDIGKTEMCPSMGEI